MTGKTIQRLAVLASASLILGAFIAAPADAKKRKKKPPACASYVPGENGADEKVNVVTESATEEAPLALTVPVAQGLGSGRDPASPTAANVSHAYVPIQVDTKTPAGGALYIQATWSVPPEDYDLYLDTADGTEVANAAGYGPVDDGSTEDSVHAVGSETIISVDTPDCGGYTLDVVGATTPGADLALTIWLGE
jgi:hypothetical protein